MVFVRIDQIPLSSLLASGSAAAIFSYVHIAYFSWRVTQTAYFSWHAALPLPMRSCHFVGKWLSRRLCFSCQRETFFALLGVMLSIYDLLSLASGSAACLYFSCQVALPLLSTSASVFFVILANRRS